MSGSFFRASGIDPNNGAKTIFVWHRDQSSDEYILLGSGPIVSGEGSSVGVAAGQFSVTFLLPPGKSVNNVVATDDKLTNKIIENVNLDPCSFQEVVSSIAPITQHAPFFSSVDSDESKK